MKSLLSLSVADMLDALASSAEPVPAGGAAAALAGAAGASLLVMAATLPSTRAGASASAEMDQAAAELRARRDALAAAIERDTNAYRAWIQARRGARDAPDDPSRHSALAAAGRAATDVPLETMRLARESLSLSVVVAGHAARGVRADASVGVELLLAAVRGTATSVDANLLMLKDAEYVAQASAERERLERGSRADAERARAALDRRTGV
jgi:glutamate formiminotransferase/formiminotetrahydrofolate cyclodeaminase